MRRRRSRPRTMSWVLLGAYSRFRSGGCAWLGSLPISSARRFRDRGGVRDKSNAVHRWQPKLLVLLKRSSVLPNWFNFTFSASASTETLLVSLTI